MEGVWRYDCVQMSAFRDAEGGHVLSMLILGKNCFLRRKKKGGFRGGVDECVDGGILIGVILS